MPHTYRFADAARTTVVRDDGATFPWASNLTPAVVGAQLGGFIGEDYRMDGCPMPADNVKAVEAAEPHVLKVSPSNTTGKPVKGPRRRRSGPVVLEAAKAKLKAKPKAKAKPPGKRKYR